MTSLEKGILISFISSLAIASPLCTNEWKSKVIMRKIFSADIVAILWTTWQASDRIGDKI